MNHWELLLYLLVAVVGLAGLVVQLRRRARWAWVLAVIVMAWALAGALVWEPASDPVLARALPARESGPEFVSSDACRSCHPAHYQSWHDSFHRTMTQVASPATVLAPFDQVVLESRERRYELSRRGDEFWVRMADPDLDERLYDRGIDPGPSGLPLVDRRIVMTTGSHHFQVYWLPSRAGYGLTQLPFVYDIAGQRWLPREDAFLTPPGNRRHFAHWNTNCIQCHSTAGRPGLDAAQNALFSEAVELGISCEACHGPGQEHVRKHRNPLSRFAQRHSDEPDPTIVNPLNCSPEEAIQICGQCHAHFYPRDMRRWLVDGFADSYRPGSKQLSESRFVLRYDEPADDPSLKKWLESLHNGADSVFWSDGTIRVGGREYNGLLESACYQRGSLSCLSCHSMHDSRPDDQLGRGMDGNHACLQCHASLAERIEQHTHHGADSTGSVCYNCHMPHTSYALLKAIRSHRIDSPVVPAVGAAGRPNACNLCHLDQTLAWTSRYLAEWYGAESPELGEDEAQIAASLLWLLRGDAAQRAIAAWHAGWQPAQDVSGQQWLAPFLAQLLDDPYSAVRFVAGRSLRRLPGYSRFSYDFVAGRQQRVEARQRAMELWTGAPADRELRQLLFDDQGQVRAAEVQRLLGEMDNRPIFIAE